MKNVYFIGIGGIGMSALARYFKFKGYAVSGYDKTPSELTAALMAEGIPVHYEDRPDLVPDDVEETLVIYTPAIHELHELDFVRGKGYRLIKRSRALGEVARGQRCLAVAGTHGKTTTSTLTAHIFTESGEGCTAFLGGISRNYGTNLLMSRGNVVVAPPSTRTIWTSTGTMPMSSSPSASSPRRSAAPSFSKRAFPSPAPTRKRTF